jgi:hypothetical protein
MDGSTLFGPPEIPAEEVRHYSSKILPQILYRNPSASQRKEERLHRIALWVIMTEEGGTSENRRHLLFVISRRDLFSFAAGPPGPLGDVNDRYSGAFLDNRLS